MMKQKKVEKIAVLGAGVMGQGITQIAAGKGYIVTIRDIAQEFLDKAKDRIEGSLTRQVARGRMTEEASRKILGEF